MQAVASQFQLIWLHGWNGIFPLGTSIPEISLKRYAACENSESKKTAFYNQALGDLRYRRHTHNLFLFPGRARPLSCLWCPLSASCRAWWLVRGAGGTAPGLCGEGLMQTGRAAEVVVISLGYCGVTRTPCILAGWHPWNIFLTWIAKEITKIWNGQLESHFTKLLPDDKSLGQSRHLLMEWNQSPWMQDA